ncbi:MAG: adenylate/guanylate cyclase domain-containing protein, partial [Acidiferrobacterales bacterium]|nr:adenylate/guanylate cyclase domain-containing protein [Acidiferrobacterales bacterium]
HAEALARLKESEERYALAARGANDGLWDWSIESGKVFYAERLREILNLEASACSIAPEKLCRRLRPVGFKSLWEALLEKFERQEPKFEFECELLDDSGQLTGRWVVARGLLVYQNSTGRRIVGSMRDITDRKRVERDLAVAEGKRAQLARYFSANMINDIISSGTNLSSVREQPVAVLFADLFNFTEMSAHLSGFQVIALLREYYGLMEEAVFVNGGTLEKYIGDGIMATFGTPKPGSQDASNALASARAMVTGMAQWNLRRQRHGEAALRIGIGLHYGEVTLGNVGSERRLELTVLGHTVNLASRLEHLTRDVDPAIIMSDALLQQARREGVAELTGKFVDLGPRVIRGQSEPLRIWGLENEH